MAGVDRRLCAYGGAACTGQRAYVGTLVSRLPPRPEIQRARSACFIRTLRVRARAKRSGCATVAQARRCQCGGEWKSEIRYETPDALIARGRAWRAAFGERPVWVAASTRAGEEIRVLDAFRQCGVSSALLILAPRHPQRFDEVAALLKREGWRAVRRTAWAPVQAEQMPFRCNEDDPIPAPLHCNRAGEAPALPAEVQILLGDSMGELGAYYAASNCAFIGGS